MLNIMTCAPSVRFPGVGPPWRASASHRRPDIGVFVANRMVLLARVRGVNVEFMAQRQPTALGNPHLTIGLYLAKIFIGPLGMRAVHGGRFTVNRFIAEIAAGGLALLPVFFLFLHHLLQCPVAASPF